MKHASLLLLTLLVILPLGACAILGDKPSTAAAADGGEKAAAISQETLQQELIAQVEDYLARSAGQGPADARLEHYDPYYFKVYNVYPGGPSDYLIDMTETDSRTAPHAADVRLPRQRIATPMHRDRQAAREDESFLRETGTQVLTYEYRNGRWVRTGSLFMVDRTEQQTAGGWEPVPGKPSRIAEGADGGNWFTRTWSSLVGK
jgi:hypothetical protein